MKYKPFFGLNLDEGCSAAAGSDQCSRSDARKLSRKKRTVSLPNSSAVVIQSRLFIPQLPVGFYLVWIRIRFFIRAMFTDATMWVEFNSNHFDEAINRKILMAKSMIRKFVCNFVCIFMLESSYNFIEKNLVFVVVAMIWNHKLSMIS